MTIDGLLSNVRALRSALTGGSLIREALQPHEEEIAEQQRIQLLEGKGSDGRDLHPFYSEDLKPAGYFRTKDSAQRYSEWKQTISYPFTVKRNPDAPNLYITGVFHNDLGVEFRGDGVAIVPDTAYASKIMAKYGFGVFGLSMERWAVVFDELGARYDLLERMRNMIWQ